MGKMGPENAALTWQRQTLKNIKTVYSEDQIPHTTRMSSGLSLCTSKSWSLGGSLRRQAEVGKRKVATTKVAKGTSVPGV